MTEIIQCQVSCNPKFQVDLKYFDFSPYLHIVKFSDFDYFSIFLRWTFSFLNLSVLTKSNLLNKNLDSEKLLGAFWIFWSFSVIYLSENWHCSIYPSWDPNRIENPGWRLTSATQKFQTIYSRKARISISFSDLSAPKLKKSFSDPENTNLRVKLKAYRKTNNGSQF